MCILCNYDFNENNHSGKLQNYDVTVLFYCFNIASYFLEHAAMLKTVEQQALFTAGLPKTTSKIDTVPVPYGIVGLYCMLYPRIGAQRLSVTS